MVLVGGEAGVGKTSLVDAFCDRSTDGPVVLRTSCDALSTPGPLAPVRDLAPALGLRIDHPSLDGDTRDRLFREVLAVLAALPGPMVIVAEDAHWADGATLELLRFLGRRIGRLPVLVIVTYRDDEIGADHPLRLVLGDLATAPAVHRMGVLSLSEEGVRRLAEGSGRDANALYRLTGGNPFFVTEVLATAGATVPPTVGDAVLARAARLSPEARAVLDVAAVIGSTIDATLLLTVAGPVLDEADECIARGVLRGTDDALTFSHDLTREAILASIAPLRRRLLHARVLAALREAPDAERDLAQLAHHAEAAGDRAAVLEFAIAAAEQAAALGAHREAAAQYARVLRFANGLPADQLGALLVARSYESYLTGQVSDAIDAGEAALQVWRQTGNHRKEGDTHRRLSRLYWLSGRNREAEAAASAALALLESLPASPELAMAYSNQSQLRMVASDLAEAIAWGEKAIGLAERFGETETVVHALLNVGIAGFFDDERALEQCERSLQLARKHDLKDHAARAFGALATNFLTAYQFAPADRYLSEGIAYSAERDLDHIHSYLIADHARSLLYQGHWTEAIAVAQSVVRQPGVARVSRFVALRVLGQVQARQGAPEAGATLDEALALALEMGELQRIGPVRAARAEAALLAGDRERVRAELEAVRALVFERGNRWQQGEIAWLLWQAGERQVPTEGVAEPYALLVAGDVAAAAAAWHELGCAYEEASALAASDDPEMVRQAVVIFEDLGAKPAITRAIDRLRTLGVDDLPALRRGPRATTRAHPAGLTQREAEVLTLVAEGLRNAEIAERLYLTPKTVSHHLSAIYAKLGVATRIEAAQAASHLGIVAR